MTKARSADEVVRFAEECVRRRLPATVSVVREASALSLSRDGRIGVRWDLSSAIRHAARADDWRARVVERSAACCDAVLHAGPVVPAGGSNPENAQIRLMTRSEVPPDYGAEVFPGLVALVGWPDPDGTFVANQELSARVDDLPFVEAAAINTLTGHPFCGHTVHRLRADRPVFSVFHPNIATTLFAPLAWTNHLGPMVGGTEGLLAAIPAADLMLVAVDSGSARRILLGEAARIRARLPRPFPSQLYRFTRGAWAVETDC